MTINMNLLIITLNVNSNNAQIKGHSVAEWVRIKTHIYDVYKRPA